MSPLIVFWYLLALSGGLLILGVSLAMLQILFNYLRGAGLIK